MTKFYQSPSPVIPDDPDDPRWPDTREERCARYHDYYSLFWRLQVINRAKEWAERDRKQSTR
jgi:hypothetical protein